jgi:hypothetical protein
MIAARFQVGTHKSYPKRLLQNTMTDPSPISKLIFNERNSLNRIWLLAVWNCQIPSTRGSSSTPIGDQAHIRQNPNLELTIPAVHFCVRQEILHFIEPGGHSQSMDWKEK